jgi:trigger factor
VVVKEVKEKVLPEVDDEFAQQASEFTTAAELRADVEQRLSSMRRATARFALRQKAQEAVAALVDDDVPEAMIAAEMRGRLDDLALRLQQQGVSLEQYFAASGRSPDEITAELREGATEAVKLDLALRAIVAAEGIEVTDDELDAELATFAQQVSQDIETVRARFRDAGQLTGIRSGMQKGKALDWVLDHAEIVDQHGAVIDRASLEHDDEDADDADDRTELAGDAETGDDDSSETDTVSTSTASTETAEGSSE